MTSVKLGSIQMGVKKMGGWDLDEVYAIQEASLHTFKQLPREVDVNALYNFYSKNLRTWFVTKQKYLRGQNLQVTNLSLILCYYMVSSSSTKFNIFLKIPQVCQRSDPWLAHGMTQFPKNRLPRVHLNDALRHREGCQCRKAIGAAELTLAAMLPRRIHRWKKMVESSSKDILKEKKWCGSLEEYGLRSKETAERDGPTEPAPRCSCRIRCTSAPRDGVFLPSMFDIPHVSTCRCICVHTCVYIYMIYIYTHTIYVLYIYLYIYVCTHTLHICIYIYVYMCMIHVCGVYIYIYIYTYVFI